MKLYTEEQVKFAMQLATFTDDTYNQVLEKLTPIEIPSDEDIEKYAEANCYDAFHEEGLEKGAKWMKEQILNQNKG